MCRPTFALLSLFVSTWLALPAEAEVFVLKSGGRVEGELLNPRKEQGQTYQVRTVEGIRLALADSAVQRVIVKSDLDKQYEAKRLGLTDTVADQWAMAEWCREAGLSDERLRHLRAVIAIDANHAEARKALGYRQYGSRWMTADQYMESLGYLRYKGAWRLRQEIEIESRETQRELTAKKLRKDIRTWFEQVNGGGRYADSASRNLDAIDDPAAAMALAEMLGDAQQPRSSRMRSLKILSKLPPGLAGATLTQVAMDDADESLRDACLDELKRQGVHTVLPDFFSELKSKSNARVNRAAECIQRLNDTSATLPLINALVTEHRESVSAGGPPGGITTAFNSGGGGSGGPGGGGLSMGGKPKVIKKQLKNASVLAALASLYPDVNYQYDIESWRDWYVQRQNAGQLDLRRDH